MVRDADRRTKKYTAKIVGDVVKNRIDALKESMVEQATDQFVELVKKEEAINQVLATAGVHSITKPFYLSYGRKIYGLKRKHAGDTLNEECCISTKAFQTRGLDPAILIDIALDVFGVDVSACTT